jgi:hypothetical protein
MKTWTENGKVQIDVNDEQYIVHVVGTFSRYKNGEDADGNRGWIVTDMDDVKIDTIEPEPPDDQREAVENAVYDLMADDFEWEGREEE